MLATYFESRPKFDASKVGSVLPLGPAAEDIADPTVAEVEDGERLSLGCLA